MVTQFEKTNKIVSEKKTQRLAAVVTMKKIGKLGITRVMTLRNVRRQISEVSSPFRQNSPRKPIKNNLRRIRTERKQKLVKAEDEEMDSEKEGEKKKEGKKTLKFVGSS